MLDCNIGHGTSVLGIKMSTDVVVTEVNCRGLMSLLKFDISTPMVKFPYIFGYTSHVFLFNSINLSNIACSNIATLNIRQHCI